MKFPRHRRRMALMVATAVATAAGAAAIGTAASAATGCQASYSITNQWQGGFGANVTVTNLGDQVNGWRVTWAFGAGQTITQLWNGVASQSGAQVSVADAGYNASIATGASASFGFNGSWTGSNPVPTSLALNGTTCTGSTTGPTTPPATTPPVTTPPATTPPATTPPPAGSTLPSSFRWSSSGVLISPKPDSTHAEAGVKDPSVVYYNGKYHVFSSVASAGGYNLEYRSFTDWSQASAATPFFLDRSAIGTGYRAAPQVFYNTAQGLWYLVYQTGNASYSTNSDIANPAGWSAPKNFYSGTPSIITQNIGSGYWVDMWVICDSANCYLFSSDDNGHLYRSQTTLANFPSGMSQPVIAKSDTNKNNLFEASNVYKVAGTDKYLLIVECIGSDGRRYFRTWTSTSIGGAWTDLAASESNPFARASNTTFSGTAWTKDISHGEMIRAGYDQTLTISPCNMRFLYQGLDPSASGDYNTLPWHLGLLTQTNSTC